MHECISEATHTTYERYIPAQIWRCCTGYFLCKKRQLSAHNEIACGTVFLLYVAGMADCVLAIGFEKMNRGPLKRKVSSRQKHPSDCLKWLAFLKQFFFFFSFFSTFEKDQSKTLKFAV